MLRKERWIVIALVGLPSLLPLPASAQADCNDKLAELDALIADEGALDEQQRQSVTGIRAMAEQMCDQGNGGLASRMLDGALEMAGKPQQAAEETAPSLPKTELTIEYLAGEWCSRGREVVPHVFAEDGSYKIGVPAGDDFGMFDGGDSIQDFRDNYDRLVSKEPDRFVMGDRGYESTFTRESCR